MYLNRGMIEAARTEGEMAGVMAHELSHVALRHGTAQASKATKYEIGELAGAVLGAIIGGNVGAVVAQGTQFGLGTAFLRFGREYERQADILGAQIMARAGYDPREMANMFKTIEKQGGSGGPEWLSEPPEPRQPPEYILKEAQIAPRRESDSRLARLRAGEGPSAADVRRRRPPKRRSATPNAAASRRRHRHQRTRPAMFRRTRRAALVAVHDLRRRRHLPGQRSLELARAAGQRRGDLCAGGRLRHAQRTERVHPRDPDWPRAERSAQPADGNRRADRRVCARQSGPGTCGAATSASPSTAAPACGRR